MDRNNAGIMIIIKRTVCGFFYRKQSRIDVICFCNVIIYLCKSVAYVVNILRIINTKATKLRRWRLAYTRLPFVCARFMRPSVSLSLSSQRKLRLRNH